MQDADWILIDTETTGLTRPIFVVDLAAQRMRGWRAQGPAFRHMLNQNVDIPPEVSRVHGYTREILERDGIPALDAYRKFADYVQGRPLVSYNLKFDVHDVLEPEWQRLGIPAIGSPGFCALRLAQRLLDPVPAGNCKLQTLRQYYRLPERGAHSAAGDVETVADLLEHILKPIAEERGLRTWEQIVRFTSERWFPSRIAFGKYKGRLFREAKTDRSLREWIEWLANSSSAHSAELGAWYLIQLALDESAPEKPPETGVVAYASIEVANLKQMIAAARQRLAEIEAEFTAERHAVSVTQAKLFELLRKHYQKRDRLRRIVDYRRQFVFVLIREGEEEAEEIIDQFDEASRKSDTEYEEAAVSAEGLHSLGEEEAVELQKLWRKLVKLFHPDRFSSDPEKLASYTQLTSEINAARDRGGIDLLREIAADPNAYMQKHGMLALDFSDAEEAIKLKNLLDTLNMEIIAALEAASELRADPKYELHVLVSARPEYLGEVASGIAEQLEKEAEELAVEADRLAAEIKELTGNDPPI